MAKLTTQVKKDPFTFKKHGKVKKKEKHGKRMKKKENNLREQLSIGGSVKQIIDNANAVAGGSTNGEKKIKKNKNKFHKLQDNEISSTTQSTNEVVSFKREIVDVLHILIFILRNSIYLIYFDIFILT